MSKARAIRVRGQVQGVGFRPFVYQLAKRFSLSGEVRNDGAGVYIHVEGPGVEAFEKALVADAPPLSRITSVESHETKSLAKRNFSIVSSRATAPETAVTPDAATCADCLAEINTPTERRYGYAFANCTNCGPRFSILQGLPYDRALTSMANFHMCAQCRSEYENPLDRRFHAQPIACPNCGPKLWAERDQCLVKHNVVQQAAEWLKKGEILAIKGIGGFHLACNAQNPEALALLRERKRRPGKPLALMATVAMARRFSEVDAAACARLKDPEAPIVLLRRNSSCALPDEVAPGQNHLGWLHPYTPLHHLLLSALGAPLVMTSGNLSGEPQVVGNDEAREKLAEFADAFLLHDRDIVRRLDDSVEVIGPSGPMVLRRARGRVPGTLPLPPGMPERQVVAFGGQMKSAICLINAGRAVLSHHLGDLDKALSIEEFNKAEADLTELFQHSPEAVAVDLHPEFHATRHGVARSEELGIPVVRVQHHHAHMAGALGEAGWNGRVAIGLVLDGLGLGADGTLWGGEVLVGDYGRVDRMGWLKPAPLVGGDRAQSEPWRNAVVRLDAVGLDALADRLFAHLPLAGIRAAAETGFNAPQSSSAGRLFDAVAACLGLVPERQSHEGEAAMQLQSLAERSPRTGAYPHVLEGKAIDPGPMLLSLADDLSKGVDKEIIAARFHGFLIDAFSGIVRSSTKAFSTDTIALSGGCFQNTFLLRGMVKALDGFRLCLPGEVPANDGGLAYGQALVALAAAENGFERSDLTGLV